MLFKIKQLGNRFDARSISLIVSVAALAISLCSMLISYYNSKQTTLIATEQIRTEVLIKIIESRRLLNKTSEIVLATGFEELAGSELTEKLRKQMSDVELLIDKLYGDVEISSNTDSLYYQNQVHRAHSMLVRCKDILDMTTEVTNKIEDKTNEKKGDKASKPILPAIN